MTQKEQVKAELELIRIQHGGVLQAEDVIAYAKDPDTALHQEFEWDDNEAAHQYRLEQARRVADYIAGMTDRYALQEIRRLEANGAVPSVG